MAENVEYVKRTEMPIGFWCGNLKETDNLEDLSVDGEILLKCV
jgi:hypothetical protein